MGKFYTFIPAEFQPYVALGEHRAFGWGEAVTLEFGIFITPRFSLSLGTGYSRHKLDGQKSPFPTKEYLDSEGEIGREDFYAVIPGVEFEVMPFFLNASYRIPLPRGVYSVALHFAEVYYHASGLRRFDISLEGETREENYEPFAAGYATEDIWVDDSIAVEDEALDIVLVPRAGSRRLQAWWPATPWIAGVQIRRLE